jgi:lincosamide nucleotidyltransferase A/C/D/E
VKLLSSLDVPFWLAGGWAMDALLHRQTRSHSDLDLIVARDDETLIVSSLTHRGSVIEEDERPSRLAMRDPQGVGIDLLFMTVDEQGCAHWRLYDGSTYVFAADALSGVGRIDSTAVSCLSAAGVVEFTRLHRSILGENRSSDIHGVRRTCTGLGLPIPADYSRRTLARSLLRRAVHRIRRLVRSGVRHPVATAIRRAVQALWA